MELFAGHKMCIGVSSSFYPKLLQSHPDGGDPQPAVFPFIAPRAIQVL